MSRRHGRAVLPFGKYKGVRLALVPDSYLSYLTTFPGFLDRKWGWLLESLVAELKHRGLEVNFDFDVEAILEPQSLTPKKRTIILENGA